MAEDYALPVRRAVLSRLKAFGPLTELVPAGSIWPAMVPANSPRPLIRFGTMIPTPFRASQLDSSSIRFSIQGFAGPLLEGGAVVETAEDQALKIGSAIKDALDGGTITLENGLKVRIQWVTSSSAADPTERDIWRTTVTFVGEVAG